MSLLQRGWAFLARVNGEQGLNYGIQNVTFNQVDQDGNQLQQVTGVQGFGLMEEYVDAFGLKVITRKWKLQAATMPAVIRVNITDQVVDKNGAVWVVCDAPQLIVQNTQWDLRALRQDCLMTLLGTTATLEQVSTSVDSSGFITNTWMTVASDVPTRWEVMGSTLSSFVGEEFGEKYMVESFQIYTLRGDCSIGQRWNIGNDADGNPMVYRIESVNPVMNRSLIFPNFTMTVAIRERGMTPNV